MSADHNNAMEKMAATEGTRTPVTDLPALRALAVAATPSDEPSWWPTETTMRSIGIHPDFSAYIAALDPTTVLSLIDAAEREQSLREALIWCSGSPSFQPEGEAREGWVTICQPLLAARDGAPETCDICGSGDRLTVLMEPGMSMPIVGCGNPWHYTLVAPRT